MSFYDFSQCISKKILSYKAQQTPITRMAEHLLTNITATNELDKTLCKRCPACSKRKARKDTIHHCLTCPEKPGLCLSLCFPSTMK